MGAVERISNRIVAQAAAAWLAGTRRLVRFLDENGAPADEPGYAASKALFADALKLVVRQLEIVLMSVPTAVGDEESGPNDACVLPAGRMGAFTALTEARRRWGETAYVRWRKSETEEILGREAAAGNIFQVGQFDCSVTGERFCCHGEGPSWEAALKDADRVASEL
jgi:hypothetical protein